MQAHKKLSPNKEGFTRKISVLLQGFMHEISDLLQGFTREKIDIILGLGCEKPCESLCYLRGGAFPILIHWPELYPILIQWPELYLILKHWPELYPILIHYSRQPIKFEYFVTRVGSQSDSSITSPELGFGVVSQSESGITSPESSRLGSRSLLGSRLESARYSLS